MVIDTIVRTRYAGPRIRKDTTPLEETWWVAIRAVLSDGVRCWGSSCCTETMRFAALIALCRCKLRPVALHYVVLSAPAY